MSPTAREAMQAVGLLYGTAHAPAPDDVAGQLEQATHRLSVAAERAANAFDAFNTALENLPTLEDVEGVDKQ